jgi:hypothetical protein
MNDVAPRAYTQPVITLKMQRRSLIRLESPLSFKLIGSAESEQPPIRTIFFPFFKSCVASEGLLAVCIIT